MIDENGKLINWSEEEYWPSWFFPALFSDNLPWDDAQKVSVSDFLRTYTLHDSDWIGLWLYPGRGLVAAIGLDAYWINSPEERIDFYLDEEVKKLESDADVVGGTFLFIWFSHMSELRQSGDIGNYEGHSYQTIYDAESTDIPDSNGLVETSVWAANESYRVHIRHTSRISILCMNGLGRVITIPDLQPNA